MPRKPGAVQVRLIVNSNCDRRCKLNSGRLPAHASTMIHRSFEEGASARVIRAAAAKLNIEVSASSLNNHRTKHMTVADVQAPDAQGSSGRQTLPTDTARPSRRDLLESLLHSPSTSAELKVKIIVHLDNLEGTEDGWAAMAKAMRGQLVDLDAEFEEAEAALDDIENPEALG